MIPIAAWVQAPSLTVCAEQCHARCCRSPGHLRLSLEEARRLARYRPHLVVRRVPGDPLLALTFGDSGGRCPFLSAEDACTVYADRPNACRRFPQQPTSGCLVWPA